MICTFSVLSAKLCLKHSVSFLAMSALSFSEVTCVATKTNSSPPNRASKPCSLRQSDSRLETERSNSSPQVCPSVSLTSLNISKSMKNKAKPDSLRDASSMDDVKNCSNKRRLGNSVNKSVDAIRSSSCLMLCCSLRSISTQYISGESVPSFSMT